MNKRCGMNKISRFLLLDIKICLANYKRTYGTSLGCNLLADQQFQYLGLHFVGFVNEDGINVGLHGKLTENVK